MRLVTTKWRWLAFRNHREICLLGFVGFCLFELKTINDLIEQTKTDEAKFCAYWKVKALDLLSGAQAQSAIAMLKKKLEAANGTKN